MVVFVLFVGFYQDTKAQLALIMQIQPYISKLCDVLSTALNGRHGNI